MKLKIKDVSFIGIHFRVKESHDKEEDMKKHRKLIVFLAIVAGLSLLFACGPKARKPVSQLDTPAHHTYTGMKFLDQQKYDKALEEFESALQLDPKFSRAYAGKGLVLASQGNYDEAEDQMDKADKYAKTKEDKAFYHVAMIRYLTLAKPDEDWLDDAEDEFEDALDEQPESSAAYYFMGIAYKTAYEFRKAGDMFVQVIELKGEYTREADREWKLMQKIERAMPGSRTGKQIALVDKITRADLAALFMEELKIDELYKRFGVRTFDTSFVDPEKYKMAKEKAALPSASDIGDHPLKNDVEGILAMGVRGLEVNPDGRFYPGDLITRAAYAMMIEDILMKVGQDPGLATKFIGAPSPFPDLRSDLPYFNAVMVVTTRGIMEAQDITSGEFVPLGPVSGADALLIIRNIQEQLKL